MPDNSIYSGGIAMVKIDGGKVRQLREKKELTQLYVATVVGVTTDTISRWENRRYPTIKKENAVKLAEALEVTLPEILEQEEEVSEASETEGYEQEEEKEEIVGYGFQDFLKRNYLILSALIIIAGAAIVIGWWYMNRQEASVTARRLLPQHAAPGKPFPVVIEVETKAENPFSIIIKENMPHGCTMLQSIPPSTTADSTTSTIKWISKIQKNKTLFAYTAKTDPQLGAGMMLKFSGTVTLRRGKGVTADIGGKSQLEITDFHWADTNEDGRIDDSEILAAYDLVGSIKGLDFGQDKIEEIWASSGYRWNEAKHEYTVLP